MLEKRVLPKVGDKIPVDQFSVSQMNMRAEEPFGESEEDQALIEHFKHTSVVQPFKARPEDKEGHWEPGMDLGLAVGYGVVIGSRRFRAMKATGRYKEFTAGMHFWIEEMSDEDAMDASLKENLEEFHKTPDPMTRANAINRYVSRMPTGLRGLARAWGMPHSTLSEYLKILDLNPAMQEAVQKNLVSFRDALATARLKLGNELQTKLAETVKTQGSEAFKRDLAGIMAGKGKKGIPAGVYIVVRSMFDKRSKDDIGYYEALQKLADKWKMDIGDCAKKIIVDRIKSGKGK